MGIRFLENLGNTAAEQALKVQLRITRNVYVYPFINGDEIETKNLFKIRASPRRIAEEENSHSQVAEVHMHHPTKRRDMSFKGFVCKRHYIVFIPNRLIPVADCLRNEPFFQYVYPELSFII